MFGATCDSGHGRVRAMLHLTGEIPGSAPADDHRCALPDPAPAARASQRNHRDPAEG